MRNMTDEEKKRYMADLPKYMPEHLGREFLTFLEKFYAKWVENAKTVVGDDPGADVPVGFWPFLVQTTLAAGVVTWAKEYGPTACLVTMLEALSKFAAQAESVNFAEFLASDPVRHLAEAHGLLKEG